MFRGGAKYYLGSLRTVGSGADSMPTSLFGRAIALARKGEKEKSDIDRAAVLKADPGVGMRFESFGMTF